MGGASPFGFIDGDPTSMWTHVLNRLPWVSGHLLVEIGGIVLALVLSRRRTAPAVCVIIALGAMLVMSVASIFVQSMFAASAFRGDRPFEESRSIMNAVGVLHTLVNVAGIATLVVAALAWRARPGGDAAAPVGAPPAPATPASNGLSPPTAPTPLAYNGVPPPDSRIPKWLYLACLYAGPLLSLLLLAPAFIVLAQNDEDLLPVAFLFVCSSGLPLVVATVMGHVLTYKLWSTIRDGDVRTSPGKAVGFCFIPFFNLYWVFQAIHGWTVDFNNYTRERGIAAPRAPEGLALTICIISLLMVLPYVNILIGLAAAIPAFIFHNRAISCANTVRAWRA